MTQNASSFEMYGFDILISEDVIIYLVSMKHGY